MINPRFSQEMGRTQQPVSGPKVTLETIESVDGNLYTIRGYRLPGNDVQAQVGESVFVEWSANRPVRVINFEARRGSTHVIANKKTVGVVEQVFIANSHETTPRPTIWFRNYNQVTELKYEDGTRLYADWGSSNPTEVQWGVNTDVFCVRVGEVFYIYRLNRTSLTKVYGKTQKAKVTEKIATVDLDPNGSNPPDWIDLCTYTTALRRNATLVNFTASYDGADAWDETPSCDDKAPVPFTNPPIGYSPTVTASAPRESDDVAAVDRVVKIQVKGRSVMRFVATIANTERGTLTATARKWIVDENNHLLYTLKILCLNVGAAQSPSGSTDLTGFTGHRTHPIMVLPVFPELAPHCSTETLDGFPFASGADARPEAATIVNETHTVVIDGNTSTVKFSTFNSTVTLQYEESNSGHLGGIKHTGDYFTGGAFSPSDYSQHTYGTTPGCQMGGAFLGYLAASDSFDAENIGYRSFDNTSNSFYMAPIVSERSLFDPALPFSPDTVTGVAADETRSVLYTEESDQQTETLKSSRILPDHCDTSQDNGYNNLDGLYTYSKARVDDRYRVHVLGDTFWSEGGNAYKFISVLQKSQRPTGHESDLNWYAAYVMIGTSLTTILAPTSTSSITPPTPTFIAGNKRHILWKLDTGASNDNWYITDIQTTTTRLVGTSATAAASWDAMFPDLPFYDNTEARKRFVAGWNRTTGELTLNQSASGFPKQEVALKKIQTLVNLSGTLRSGASGNHSQTIIDTTLLPTRYRT